MRKAFLYSAVAVVVGLSVVLIPLITFRGPRVENYALGAESMSDEFRRLEGSYGLGTARLSPSDFETLAVSLAVAVIVYLLVRRRVVT